MSRFVFFAKPLCGCFFSLGLGWIVPFGVLLVAEDGHGRAAQWVALFLPVILGAHYLTLPYLLGLICSFCWHDARAWQLNWRLCLGILMGLTTWPALALVFALPFGFLAAALYFLGVWYFSERGYRWGVKNWPLRPWRVWFGQETMPYETIRRRGVRR